jgi:hypothetical protein
VNNSANNNVKNSANNNIHNSNSANIRNSHSTGANFLFNRRWRKKALVISMIWFVGCLLYSAPATLLETVMRKCVPQLQLHNVAGSLWNGSAAQAFWLLNEGQQNNQVIALGSLEWHLQPWSLLWLHPAVHVVMNYGEQFVDARARVSPLGRLTLTQTSAALPAALLSNWVPLTARGQIALKLERAELSRAQIHTLQGVLYWQQAQWQWNSHWLALGDYRCELSVSAELPVHCAVQGQGALAIDGAVDVDTKARTWAMQMQMQAATSLPEDFRQSMQVMLAAQPDAQGKLAVKRNGRW